MRFPCHTRPGYRTRPRRSSWHRGIVAILARLRWEPGYVGSRGGSWVSELKIGEAFMLECFQFCASRIVPAGRARSLYAQEARV